MRVARYLERALALSHKVSRGGGRRERGFGGLREREIRRGGDVERVAEWRGGHYEGGRVVRGHRGRRVSATRCYKGGYAAESPQ